MSLAVDDLRRDLHARSALAKFVQKVIATGFLAVLDATFAAPAVAEKVRDVRCLFHQLADADGRRDRGALLTLLEHEKRVCEKGFGSDFEPQDGLLSLIKLGSAVGSVCFSTSVARLFYVKL
ncbi:hypothetical protein DFH11DRAFT_1731256 [Phellopilus nigrolimitatus]|nr:hypothetical protein DFH11DRAFT_1731256 [Phellopilus nigrolimitatus]